MASSSVRDNREMQRRLLEVGFLAAGMGQVGDAEVILGCLQELRPESEFPSIGLALAYLNVGRYEEAIDRLRREALTIQPESCTARAYLGLALRMAGRREESIQMLQLALSKGDDPEAKALAAALLNPDSTAPGGRIYPHFPPTTPDPSGGKRP